MQIPQELASFEKPNFSICIPKKYIQCDTELRRNGYLTKIS